MDMKASADANLTCSALRLLMTKTPEDKETSPDDSEGRSDKSPDDEEPQHLDQSQYSLLSSQYSLLSSQDLSSTVEMDEGLGSDKQLSTWRFELKPGDWIDARDTYKRWYKSVVVDVSEGLRGRMEVKHQTEGDKKAEPLKVFVHYWGWLAKWDRWIDIRSPDLALLHTYVRPWSVRVGMELEACMKLPYGPRIWVVGTVLESDDKQNKVLVQDRSTEQKAWINADSEELCSLGTHHRRKRTRVPIRSYGGLLGTSSWLSLEGFIRSNIQVPGAVGLKNLGNTCFMNSMLQCLSNCEPLTTYFLSGRHYLEINMNNPLGMGGELASSYAELLHDLWSGDHAVISPRQFKRTIGQFATQFAGYQQQDSQELMSFLLDGLHEDLNRVVRKPYTEPVESRGRPDEVVAKEAWNQFRRRNQSVIVDEFMGQLRSHVRCPKCGTQSTTFDPFMSLSLPLTAIPDAVFTAKAVIFTVTVCSSDGKAAIRYSVRVSKGDRVRELKQELARVHGVRSERLLLVELFNHRIRKLVDANAPIYPLSERKDYSKLYAFDVGGLINGFRNGRARDVGEASRLLGEVRKAPYALMEVFMESPGESHEELPFVIMVRAGDTQADVCQSIWAQVARFVKPKKGTVQNPPYKLYFHTEASDPAGDEITFVEEELEVPEKVDECCVDMVWDNKRYGDLYQAEEIHRIEETSWPKTKFNANLSKRTLKPFWGSVDLRTCLDKFLKPEQLGEKDTWYCPNCKGHMRAHKKLDLWSLPRVLIIHLKRFQYTQSGIFVNRDKIDTLVKFDIDCLDLSSYVKVNSHYSASAAYELFAVSEHTGGLGGGHYTATAKNFLNKKWYFYNDEKVSERDPKKVITSRPYVLFYIRKDDVHSKP